MLAALAFAAALAAAPEVVDVTGGYTHVYALVGAGGVVLVDSGNPGDEDRILKKLDAAGISRDRVTALVVTHGHPDHAGSAAALAGALRVPVIAGRLDKDLLTEGEGGPTLPTGGRGAMIKPVLPKRYTAVPVDIWVDDTLDLGAYGVDATLVHTGAHTPGNLVIQLPDRTLLCSDLIRGRLLKRKNPTLHFFHDDGNAAHAALAELIAGAPIVYPAHGGPLATADVADWLDRRADKLHKKLERKKRDG